MSELNCEHNIGLQKNRGNDSSNLMLITTINQRVSAAT